MDIRVVKFVDESGEACWQREVAGERYVRSSSSGLRYWERPDRFLSARKSVVAGLMEAE